LGTSIKTLLHSKEFTSRTQGVQTLSILDDGKRLGGRETGKGEDSLQGKRGTIVGMTLQ